MNETTEQQSTAERRSDCFYQGVNGLGERLPAHIPFTPFYSFTFYVPIKTAAQFAEILAWCNSALGEREEGRWLEDFDWWHMGDVEAAELFFAAWMQDKRFDEEAV